MFLIAGTIKLIKIAKKSNINIIHGHYLFPPGLIAVIGGIITKIPVYVTCHGSDLLNLYENKKYLRGILNFILKKATKILVVSETLKEYLLEKNIPGIDSKIKIHYNAVDTEKFQENEDYIFKKELIERYGIKENDKILLYVGRLSKEKNLEKLLEAWNIYNENLLKNDLKLNSYLVIVGYGPLERTIHEKVKEDMIDNVIFTGERNDVENIIPSCDGLILPSIYESFGLILIESLSCGKPVIGSNIPAIKSIISSDVGLTFNPEDAEDIASKIAEILNNNELKESAKIHGRLKAMEFSKMKNPYEIKSAKNAKS
jgi:glycosyltransferase involved in cell wall biosynthesis